MAKIHWQFVTGKLAEASLRRVVTALAEQAGFDYSIQVLPITVAALMTPAWIAKRLAIDSQANQLMLPGYCDGDLSPLAEVTALPIVVGPRDLRALPDFLGVAGSPRTRSHGAAPDNAQYGAHEIEILAEINHAPRLSLNQLLSAALHLADAGADLIDLGCQPGEPWRNVGDAVRTLRDVGLRVSIDSFDRREIAEATAAGAELVLSVNSSNREAASDWGCEVVAVPDDPASPETLWETVEVLERDRVRFCLDPILSPIGFGFADSLCRYAECRRQRPQDEMLMGIGNVTELADVDSAGVNLLLLACCSEWRVRRVLTTQVINWARSSVRECDVARRLVHYANQFRVLPKHVESRLLMLRDARLYEQGDETLADLSRSVRDSNYRLFAERGELHLIAAGIHLRGTDPFDLFDELLSLEPKNMDAGHAFYLGYELCKAMTATTLGKQYTQDEALSWGMLTVPERHRRGAGFAARKPDKGDQS